jgi:hypothetical protein
MTALIVVLLAVHVLTGVYWAGSTFALAGSGQGAGNLFGRQMGAATVSVLTGLWLWWILHRGPPGGMERTLAIGAACAVAAAGVQGALRRSSPLLSQRIAALLLGITVICMTVARYAG